MLTYEELEYFAAFAEYGTLTEVAERFLISQPTITRAMKKAEEMFGVPLFVRTKNRISLNENGEMAAEEIRLLLKQTNAMIDRVRAHDRANRTISIGTAAALEVPGIIGRISHAFPEMAVTTESGLPQEIERGLKEERYQMIILPYDPTTETARGNTGGWSGETNDAKIPADQLAVEPIGEEHLMFYLPVEHPMAGRKSLRLEDLNGENLLLFSDIGFWAEIVRRKMPDSRFLLQNERYTFEELVENSILPCFVTDLALETIWSALRTEPEKTAASGDEAERGRSTQRRVTVPIDDPEVNVTYYLTCRKSTWKKLKTAFR